MILCCGEALIDMIPTPTTQGRDGFVPHSGGAVFNTAIAVGRLGVPVACCRVCRTICLVANLSRGWQPVGWMQRTSSALTVPRHWLL